MRLAALEERLSRPVDSASLAMFRAMFGVLLAVFIVRLWYKGVLYHAFLEPKLFFPLYGFGWLPPLREGTYPLFACLFVLALVIAAGFYTRPYAALFCALFTYAHSVDATHYLNHYYLVSLLAALLAVSPIGRTTTPTWVLWLFRFQVGVVYFFGGVAKLKHDWLFEAEPMRTWLLANTDVPLLGMLFEREWTAYAMSWLGAAYDLSIPFLLSFRRTRPFAYGAVVIFHLLTARLFNIGLFPYLMMAASLLFFPPDWPRRLLRRAAPEPSVVPALSRSKLVALALYALLQLLVPLRLHLYPGNPLWTEQGYRYAWHVMLMEKMGSVEFRVTERATGRTRVVFPSRYLGRAQTKAMATQPDMILAFAHYLAKREHAAAVYADAFVALNGRPAQRFIDPSVDLAREHEGFRPKRWILASP